MKPEVAEKWQEALSAYKKAKQHVDAGEHDKAKAEAVRAVVLGIDTMRELFPSPQEQHAVGIFAVVADAYLDKEKPTSLARDHVEKARTVLRQFINLSRPENKLWGENEL